MLTRAITALVIGLALTGAAQAMAACYAQTPGAQYSFRFQIGNFSEEDQNRFNLSQLRQMGVDATRAEMWGGCIRAFVRKPDGGEQMQFFHPDSFERVYP